MRRRTLDAARNSLVVLETPSMVTDLMSYTLSQSKRSIRSQHWGTLGLGLRVREERGGQKEGKNIEGTEEKKK